MAAEGIDCKGPVSSDTVYIKAFAGAYDSVLSMYHDQGQIATKLRGFNRGVTITAGLRTVFTPRPTAPRSTSSARGWPTPVPLSRRSCSRPRWPLAPDRPERRRSNLSFARTNNEETATEREGTSCRNGIPTRCRGACCLGAA